VIAGAFVEDNWGLSFIVPGALIGGMGFVVFLFLVPKPQHVGCTVPDHSAESQPSSSTSTSPRTTRRMHRNYTNESLGVGTSISTSGEGFLGFDSDSSSETSEQDYTVASEKTPMISQYPQQEVKIKAVGFLEALKIPGVVEYSLCLFFAKLVSYTFLYWLPRYISSSTNANATKSANLSTLFDVGGILGGIIAGVISDYSGMSATTCAGMLTAAVPMLLVYENFGGENIWLNVVLLILVGLLVNGPYTLITTAVSTDLGTHPCLKGNARALATVTSIIDGTGSIGAAVGPLLAGPVSALGWKYVFIMLIIADLIALVLLMRLMAHELSGLWKRRRPALKVTLHPQEPVDAEIP
jgi:OPA family glycerol-3-phosphate transporter-like MFS transporter 1/2